MNDLIYWLLQQVAEDEARAFGVAATDSQGNTWVFSDDRRFATTVLTKTLHVGDEASIPVRYADPPRVRAECEAKRAIINDCVEALRYASPSYMVESADEEGAILAERTLRNLGTMFADRPGYREEWKP